MGIRAVSAGLALLMTAGAVAEAASIKIWVANDRRTGNGGEFIASNWTPDLTYNGKALAYGFATDAAVQAQLASQHGQNTPAFGTFCIEVLENLSGNTTYGAQLNDRAIKGGVGPQGDPLDNETKWIYWHYRNNTLKNYVAGTDFVTGTQAQIQARTRAVQLAIWSFEEPGQGTNALATLIINAAIAAAGIDSTPIHRVVAINLGSAGDNWRYQDQMGIVVPLPTAGGLGMAGLIGLLAFRRRVRL